MIRCVVIKILGMHEATCDGTTHEFETQKEFDAFATGVGEVSRLEGVRYEVYTKDAYNRLPAVGKEIVKRYLIDELKGVVEESK